MRSSTACARKSISCCRDEDAAEFAELEAALVAELQPVGALQTVLARRVAVAAWRLARADRIEIELFEERRVASGGLGLALIRDGNGARSFETLLRYRGAAMAEFWRALRTLKALQAEPALEADAALAAPPLRPAARPRLADRAQPNEPERALARPQYAPSEPPAPGALHEPAAPWRPNEPESGAAPAAGSSQRRFTRDRRGGSAVGRCTCRPPAIASDHAGDDRPGAAFTV